MRKRDLVYSETHNNLSKRRNESTKLQLMLDTMVERQNKKSQDIMTLKEKD
jgi:hypothetical protein